MFSSTRTTSLILVCPARLMIIGTKPSDEDMVSLRLCRRDDLEIEEEISVAVLKIIEYNQADLYFELLTALLFKWSC
jgi:hypothetical protein